MATNIRPETSKKNKYWISKHRYYELKHFCLQYYEYKSAYNDLSSGYIPAGIRLNEPGKAYTDPTATMAILMEEYLANIKLIEESAYEADEQLATYILKAVTQEFSFNYLKYYEEMPCSRDMFYDRYRKFFWILSKKKIRK